MSRPAWHAALLSIAVAAGLWPAARAAQATPLAAGDLVVTTNGGCCSSGPVTIPNAMQLDPTGQFKSWFFDPFAPSDIAIDKAGDVLFGSSSSGTIVATTSSGGFVRLIPTPAPSVNGIAVEGNGNLVVASGNGFYELDPQGQLLNLVFGPSTGLSSSNLPIGFDTDGEVVFAAASSSYSAPLSIDFLNLQTRVLRSVATSFTVITALDASETGDLIVVGQTGGGYPYVTTINRLGLDGTTLSQIPGPQGVATIAVANLPEPAPALLVGAGLALLARRRARERRAERGEA